MVSSSQVTHLHLLAAWLEPASPDRPYQVEIELRNGGVLGAGMLRVTGRGRWGFDGDLPVALAEVRAVRIVRDGRPVLRGEAPAP
ncbi:MAG: hypothetical protein IMX02_07445 [Limnochordaceae bacterium]|nr:hypothetical protein [Limnochordaceae bacterium]